jgi:hypothetical protein
MKNRIDHVVKTTPRDIAKNPDVSEICDACGVENEPGIRICFNHFTDSLYLCNRCAAGKTNKP